MKKTKKSLLFSGLALMMSALLLAGTTFAWFTDSVTNKGNTITAGTLDVELNDGKTTPLFSSDNNFLWEPGRSYKATATVSNEGSLWLKYTMSFTNVQTTGGADITEVLDVYTVAADAKNLDGATYLGTMKNLMAAGSFAAKDNVLAPKGEEGSSETFTLVVKMQESADNKYQKCGVTFDVTVNATQYTAEKDGFGNPNYDMDATYPVSTASGLKEQLEQGGSVQMSADVAVDPVDDPNMDAGNLLPQMTVTSDTLLNLDGHKITVETEPEDNFNCTPVLISVMNGATLTLTGNGTVDATFGMNNSYGINVAGGTLVINDGTYIGAVTAVQVQSGHAIINGGFFDLTDAAPAQYSRSIVNCIDANYKNGTATIEIKGGTFVNFDPSANPEGAGTSYVADGYKVVSEQHDGDTWYTVVPETR